MNAVLVDGTVAVFCSERRRAGGVKWDCFRMTGIIYNFARFVMGAGGWCLRPTVKRAADAGVPVAVRKQGMRGRCR